MISRRIVILRNENRGRAQRGGHGPLSRRRTTAGMQEIEQRMEQLSSRIILSPTGSKTSGIRAMKLNYPFMTLLLLVTLTTGLFPTMVLSKDRDHDHQQQPQSTRNGGVPWSALSGDEQAALKDHRRNWMNYSPAEQNKLRQGADRYLNLPPKERDAVKRKQQQYKNMSPQEREQLREMYRKQHD
jgi:hypothetical protein